MTGCWFLLLWQQAWLSKGFVAFLLPAFLTGRDQEYDAGGAKSSFATKARIIICPFIFLGLLATL